MTILSQLNSPVMYLICGCIIGFVALVCVFFAARAWKAGLAIGMEPKKLKKIASRFASRIFQHFLNTVFNRVNREKIFFSDGG